MAQAQQHKSNGAANGKGARSPEHAAFAASVRARRVAKGMSQGALAEKLGVSATAVYSYEKGDSIAKPPLRQKIDAVLGDAPGAAKERGVTTVAETAADATPWADLQAAVALFSRRTGIPAERVEIAIKG